jgi:hypothetical protein
MATMSLKRAAVLRLVAPPLLPEPVQRYFQFAGVADGDRARPVVLTQEGEFRLGGVHSRWVPFRAVQRLDPAGPGFCWDATMRVFPGLRIRVRDSYLNGVGEIEARVARVIRLAHERNTTTLALGELHRYLAEAVWNPAALLPCNGVEWNPIDRNSARATLTAHGHTVSLDFLFDAEGGAVQAYTHARYRTVGRTVQLTPWLCSYGDYRVTNGVMIPREGEVGWLLPDGLLSYCRLRVSG